MPKWCVVPNCKSGSRTRAKRSVFRVPKDAATMKKWQDAIPGLIQMNPTDVVCERHFNKEDISREWIKHDADGKVIARVAYKHPQLQKHAIPSRFGNALTGQKNCVPFHEYAKTSYSQTNSRSIENQCNVSVQSSRLTKTAIQGISTISDISDVSVSAPAIGTDIREGEPAPIKLSSEVPVADTFVPQVPVEVPSSMEISEDISRVPSPTPINELSPSLMEESTCVPAIPDLLAPRISAGVRTSRKNSQQIPDENANVNHDFCAYVPEGWCWGNMHTEIVQQTLFTYAVTKTENDVHCPVVQKTVTLDTDGRLQYFVYGRHVDSEGTNLEQALSSKEALKDVLVKFKGTSVCSGIGDVSVHLVLPGTAYQDHVDKWRSKGCSLISRTKRCESCTKMRKCIQQRTARLKNPPSLNRITNISNPVDRCNLSAIRMKLRRERRKKIRALDRVKHLTTCINVEED